MAEKIVELSKIAPFGLKRPSAADVAALEKTPKRRNIDHKLWTHEERMFAEKTIYLNKSTTKYIIIGNDSATFAATMKICDRTTGCHITIATKEKILSFCRIAQQLVSPHEPDSINGDEADVSIVQLSPDAPDVWKISQKTGFGSIVLHKVSLLHFGPYEKCITEEVNQRDQWSSKFPEMLSILIVDMVSSPQMTPEEKLDAIQHYTYNSEEDRDTSELMFQIGFGIITNRPYLETQEAYAVFYN